MAVGLLDGEQMIADIAGQLGIGRVTGIFGVDVSTPTHLVGIEKGTDVTYSA